MLNAAFLKMGFCRAECEWCVYTHRNTFATTIVAVHVDNMLLTSSSTAEVSLFQSELESMWQITALGKPKLVVGIAICHDKPTHSIYLSQTALIDKITLIYGQTDTKSATKPMAHGTQLLVPDSQTPLDEGEQECLDTLPYWSLVGSLMYITGGS